MELQEGVATKQIRRLRTLWLYVRVFGYSGLWIWFRASVLKQGFLVELSVKNGKGAKVWLRAGTSDVDVYHKVFVDDEYKLPFDMIPLTILDLGANIGLASVYFALAFPSAAIVAVEPSRDNFELLQRNIASWPNIKAVHAAAWSEDGTVNLVDPGIGPWGMRVEPLSSSQDEPGVPAMTVPSLMSLHGIKQLDLLKVDIEGAEKEVFESSHAWIGRVNAIVAELHDRYKVGCSRTFFNAVGGLPNECWIGENIFVWR